MSIYLRWLFIVLFFGLLFSLFPIFKIQEVEVTLSLLLAPAVAAANYIVGIKLIKRGFYASQATFMKTVFGGMGIRLLVLGAIIAAVNVCAKLDFVAFLVGLLGYYTVLLALEVWYVHTRLNG